MDKSKETSVNKEVDSATLDKSKAERLAEKQQAKMKRELEKQRLQAQKERAKSERRKKPEESSSRRTRGDTRQNLIDAALLLVGSDQGSLAGISLREITKTAGVSPTAMYRHFTDLEELGMAIVEESTEMLRRMLRDVRKAANPLDMINQSTDLFVRYVLENRSLWLMISRERVGGSQRMRAAIRNQITYFTTELASDLRIINVLPRMTQTDLQRVARMVISLAISMIPDILDVPENQPRAVQEVKDEMDGMLGILIHGAVNWNPQR